MGPGRGGGMHPGSAPVTPRQDAASSPPAHLGGPYHGQPGMGGLPGAAPYNGGVATTVSTGSGPSPVRPVGSGREEESKGAAGAEDSNGGGLSGGLPFFQRLRIG